MLLIWSLTLHDLNYHDGMENTNKACRLVNFVLVSSVATVRTYGSLQKQSCEKLNSIIGVQVVQ